MSDQTRIRTVTLILQGGHTIRLGGAVDVAALIDHLEDRPQTGVVDILSDTGERLIVRRNALIGVIDNYSALDSRTIQAGEVQTELPVKPFIIIEDYLPHEDRQKVISRVLDREEEFQASTVSSGREDYRSSILLRDDEIIGPILRHKIQSAIVGVAKTLGLRIDHLIPDDAIECQITAHRDGEFYHVHNDNGDNKTASRVVSYVYYFQTRPHAFFGGELKLYEPAVERGIDITGDNYFLIKPRDNSIVFFPSHVMHEVLPTYVPSRAFSDSRFTVNGWVRNSGSVI